MAKKNEIKITAKKKKELAGKYSRSTNKRTGPYSYNKLRKKYGAGTASEIVGMGKALLDSKSSKSTAKKKTVAKKKTAPKKKGHQGWVYFYKGKKTTKSNYEKMKAAGRKSAKRRSVAKMKAGTELADKLTIAAKKAYKKSPTKYKNACKAFFKNAKPKIAKSKKTGKLYVASVWNQFTTKYSVPLAKILLKECKINLKNYSSDKYTRKGKTFTRKRKK